MEGDDTFYWGDLARQGAPVVLYGMGDGADKVLAVCRRYGVPVAGVFANDSFVRGQSYQGFRVKTLVELERELGSFTVLLCYATQRPEVLKQIETVAARHRLLVPDLPVVGDGLFTPEYAEAHREEIQAAEKLLADHWSRRVYRDILRYRLNGEPALLRGCETPKSQAWQLLEPGPEEVFVDAGAYTGDTVEEFLGVTGGRCREILALEPDRRNFRKLLATAQRLGVPGIRCLRVAAWDRREAIPFRQTSGRQSSVGEGEPDTPADSIDNILEGKPATFIKYDVEGCEAQALLGSGETIRQYRPRLIVSAYHRVGDLFRLPLLLEQICPGYRIYLRHHPYLPAWDTNLYGVPG